MEERLNNIYQYVDERKDEMIGLWRELVNYESYAREKEKVDLLAERLKVEFEKEGLDCRLVDVGPQSGKTLVGILGAERSGKPVIFSGHMDTVFPTGTFGEKPFRIEDGKAFGPGVLDMKGGIIISLYVIKALNSINFNERPIKIVFSGDEEIGHVNSTGAEVILEEAKDGICAFNMETGLIDNALCIGRKGRMEPHITVNGIEAHAGNDFASGRNAIEEMAHKILEIQKLTDLESGTTVSVSKIKGGTVSNAIPAQCQVEVDVRFENMAEMERAKQRIGEICEITHVDGTSTEWEVASSMAAYETTDDVIKFYNFCNEVAKKYGFGEMGSRRLGGSSDAAFITIAKTPVLCSCGVRGEWNHTAKEYALVDSLFERTKLLSTIVLNLDQFKE
ncbi:MAG: M20 family metallopeptidase [bacterium]|jgi:glutamate carboxypeptidase